MAEEDNSPHTDEFTELPLEAPTAVTSTVAYDPELYAAPQQTPTTNAQIEIVDAGKSREGQSRGYTVYTIQYGSVTVRRRYSEFESLRNALVRLAPTVVIPPIPEKHSLTTYATKEDIAMVDHRRRMLAVFLNRCQKTDVVAESSVFQSFLDPNANWSEVLMSPPLSDIPKNILQADPLEPAKSTAAHSYLPIPSTSVVFVRESEEDKKFNAIESQAREYEAVISGGVDKVNRRVMRHLQGLMEEFSEAGAVFNGFSLQESVELAPTLEKLGQVHDNCYLSTETLVDSLNHEFTEPLGESAQFASVVKDVLKFRQQKSLQRDITARSLKHRLNHMKLLDKAEQESKRIEEALEAGQSKTGQINFDRKVAEQKEQEKLQRELGHDVTPLAPKKQSMFKIPGISKLGNIIKETIIESDPEVVRQAHLIKTKDDINQLKQTFSASEGDLKRVTEAIGTELEKRKEERDEELKKIISSYASAVLDWSRKNLEFWEEVGTIH